MMKRAFNDIYPMIRADHFTVHGVRVEVKRHSVEERRANNSKALKREPQPQSALRSLFIEMHCYRLEEARTVAGLLICEAPFAVFWLFLPGRV